MKAPPPWLVVVVVALCAACRDVIVPTTPLPEDFLPEDGGSTPDDVDGGGAGRDDGGSAPDDGGAAPDDAGSVPDDGGAFVDAGLIFDASFVEAGAPVFDGGEVIVDSGVDALKITSITLAPIDNIPVGRTGRLVAVGALDDGGTLDISEAVVWTSMNAPVAEVSNIPGERGTVRGIAIGGANVVVTLEDTGATANVDVFVVDPVREDVFVEPAATSAPLGAVMQLNAWSHLSDGSIVDVTEDATWTSMDPGIADVDDTAGTKGRVTTVADGTAAIAASIDGFDDQALVTVLPAAVVSVVVSPSTRSVAQGLSATFTATATFTDGSSRDATADVTWTTADTDLAIPDGAPGTIRTLEIGSTTVEAHYGVGGPGGSATVTATAPVLVSVTTYDHNGYALYSHGVAKIWGRNVSGQNAHAASAMDKVPVDVAGLNDIVQITGGGNHTLALRRNGEVWAWGRYERGQLGDGRSPVIAPAGEDPWDDPTPDPVVGLDGTGVLGDVKAVATGLNFSLALLNDGTVVGWGDGWPGQLGVGDGSSSSVPRVIPGIPPAVAISAGAYHTLIVDTNGELWAMGWNNAGQIGNGTTANAVLDPVKVRGVGGTGTLQNVVAACGTWQTTIALRSDNSVVCVGYNGEGQCGINNRTSPQLNPVVTKGIGGTGTLAANAIDCGFAHVVAKQTSGTLVAWGNNWYGNLAIAGIANNMNGVADRILPDLVKNGASNITNPKTFSAGADHVVVLRSTGTTLAWGDNSDGELGDNTTTTRYQPMAISGL